MEAWRGWASSWGCQGQWQGCWCPEHPMSLWALWRGCEAPCITSGMKAVEAIKKSHEEGSWGEPCEARAAGAGHCSGWGLALRLWPAAGRGCFSPPGASSPTFLSWSETAERPLPTQTIPLFREASVRAAEGPLTGCSSGLWLSQMSSLSYSGLLEPQFKEWFQWNKIVLGNKVNTLRTFMLLLSTQKAAWTMIIKFAMRVKSWPSLLGLGFSCRHSPLGIYLAWGMIYMASRNLCTVVMNPCFEDAGFRAAVGRCSLQGPIFHYCVLPAHSQEPNY